MVERPALLDALPLGRAVPTAAVARTLGRERAEVAPVLDELADDGFVTRLGAGYMRDATGHGVDEHETWWLRRSSTTIAPERVTRPEPTYLPWWAAAALYLGPAIAGVALTDTAVGVVIGFVLHRLGEHTARRRALPSPDGQA